jgi:lysophospholipase L1-like esterase
MPTSTYGANNANIVFSGQWTDLVAGGHNAREFAGANTQIDFVATGTTLTMLCSYPSSVTIQASVDGGAFATIGNTGGAWASATIFSGLSDAAHTVTIKHTGGAQGDFYLDRDSAFSLTGASPAVASPSGFGTQYTLNNTTFVTQSSQEGGWQSESLGGYGSPQLRTTVWTDAAVRFRAKCQTIKVWTFQDGATLKFQIDGVDQSGTVVAPNTSQYGWVTLASGLDSAAEHEYGFSLAGIPGGKTYVYAVMLVGGTGLVNTTFAPRASLAGYGDSIVQATAGTGNNAAAGFLHKLALQKGLAAENRGVAGSTAKQFGSGSPPVTTQAGEAATRLPDITGLSPAPAFVVVLYGRNDMSQIGGAETVAQFQTSYQAMMGALVAALPATRFFCLGILPCKDYNAAARAPWSAAIQTVAQGFVSANVQFVSTEGWIDDGAGSADLYDNVHPNASGYDKIVTQLSSLVGFGTQLDPVIVSASGDVAAEMGGMG